jgi:plastocyanin
MKSNIPGPGKLILAFSMVLLLMVLSACTGNSTPSQTTKASPTLTATPTPAQSAPITASTTSASQTITIDLTAQGFAFNPNTITVPAGADVTINFVNKDSAPHNFAAYTDSSATTPIYVGKVITGTSITYNFKAPASVGNYFFRCDIHPNMTGTLKVVASVSSIPVDTP